MKLPTGKVFLVGAGPGDPGLITLQAVETLRQADVVLYDSLVHPAVLRFVPPSAIARDVGKHARTPGTAQGAIETLMIRHARAGRVVVRLKGGDPFLFGRGGEECEALASARVPFEVIPGVTSALAVPAYAGIPLTHRDWSSSVAIVTGHEREHGGGDEISWELLAHAVQTLVVLMGAGNLAWIAGRLLKAGLAPSTPVVAIRWGTWPQQETATATLETAADRLKDLQPPVVVVIGNVARLRERLPHWFERRPLLGVRIAVTRAHERANFLARLLEAQGAHVRKCAVIRYTPIARPGGLTSALRTMSSFSWVIFTSATGVEMFFERLRERGLDARALAGPRLAAVGPGTADALHRFGVDPDLVPRVNVAEGLLSALGHVRGARVLVPRAAAARDVLPHGLSTRGASVTVLKLYRTWPCRAGLIQLRWSLARNELDAVAFSSSSTVEFTMRSLNVAGRRKLRQRRVIAASIGPVTSRTLRRWGVRPAVEAKPHTMDGLVAALVRYYKKHRP